MDKVNILGVNLAKLSRAEILETITVFLSGSEPRLIVTPNAEFILAAQTDEEFFYILNHADLSVLDGSGPQIASFLTGKSIKRFPGADLIIEIFKLARAKDKIQILNWADGLSDRKNITDMLNEKFPGLQFLVHDLDRAGTDLDLKTINAFAPTIIISTLGAPYQEKLLFHNLKNVPSLRIAIGVGGALDFLTGKIKRAPKIMRLLGLEWLWRLAKQPWRIKRIWNATAVFIYKFLRWQFILPLLYRPNVACWLYKKEGNIDYVLMVERKDQAGHWQLPQGGTDGDSVEVAGKRELEEELGITEIRTVKIYKNVFRYSFQKQKRQEIQRHLGYKGQAQSLYIGEYTGANRDFDIKFWDHTDWKWVKADEVLETTYDVRKEGYEKFFQLYKKTITK